MKLTILKTKFKIVSVIIPRHIERVNSIIGQLEQMDLNVVVHSSKKINDKTDIYLVDTYGEAEKFYKISPTVFRWINVSKGGQILLNRLGMDPKYYMDLLSKL